MNVDGPEPVKINLYLLICKLFICFIPALLILFAAIENWPALVLSVMLCATSAHEIRKENAK